MAGFPKGTKVHKYTNEEREYMKEIAYGKHIYEITKLFNERFNLKLKDSQIKAYMKRFKIKTGFTGRFNEDRSKAKVWEKGEYPKGCEKTWFKKGNIPYNYAPLGTERITVDGYTEVKVKDPDLWKFKQRIIYEKEYGTIPHECLISFLDGDKTNFNIDNLICLTKEQSLELSRHKLRSENKEITKTGVKVADLIIAIREKEK